MKGLLLKTKTRNKKGQAEQKRECYGELINPAALILEAKEDVVFDVCSPHGRPCARRRSAVPLSRD